MNKLLIILFCCFSLVIYSQKSLETANYYYERKAYAKAIELFEPIFESNPSQDIAIKIAESHYKIRNVQKSAEYYQKASLLKPLNEEQSLKYLEVLKETGQINMAKSYAKEYLPVKSKKLIASFDSIQNWNSLQSYKIENLNINSPFNDFGLTNFTAGERIFNSDRPDLNQSSQHSLTNNNNFLDMYIFRIEDSLEGSPTLKKFKLKTAQYHDGTAYYDVLNKKLYFTRNYNNANKLIGNKSKMSNLQILIADVDSSLNLKSIKEFKYNNPDYSVGHPYLSNDGNYLYFVSDMPSGKGGTDLYVSQKLPNGDWDFPVNLGPEINTSRNEMFPYISPTNELIFSSNGHTGFGGLDLYNAVAQKDGKYGKPTNLGAVINSNYDDFALIFSDINQTKGYFSSNREGGKGGDDIYSFTKTNIKSNCKSKDFKIVAVDNKTKARLSGAVISMIDIVSNDTIVGISDNNGECTLNVCANRDYNLNIKRSQYLTNSFSDVDLTKNGYTAELYKKEVNTLVELKNIYYEFDKADIHPTATPQLDMLSNLLIQNPDIKVELSSHTDSRGKDDYNMDLSQKRAENVVKYLHFMGVESSRMIAKGYGETRLVNTCGNGSNCLEEEHVQNRRTEFRIVDIMSMNSMLSQIDPKQALKVVHVNSKTGAGGINMDNCATLNAVSNQPSQPRLKLVSTDEEKIHPEEAGLVEKKAVLRTAQDMASVPVSKMVIEASTDIPDPDYKSQPSYNSSKDKDKKLAIMQTASASDQNQSKSYFSVQLGSFSSPSGLSSFSKLDCVHMIPDNNRYIALSGKFNSLSEAERYKPIVKQSIPGAFLVRIVDGKKMALK